jgi:polysaccharide export outer membrane protein
VRATIATVVLKVRRFTSFRGALVFLGMLAIAALCVAQATKPILTPAPQPATPATTAPATTPTTQSTPPHVDPSYIIGPDDVLQITVWKEQTLSGTFPVRPDGMISMVLLGDVKAAGQTSAQLTATLTSMYKKYVQDPIVTVAVAQDTSQRIFIVGEVGHVGPVQITPGMTVLQAISSAGGVTPYAHKNRIYILRGAQGKQEKIPFNYKAAFRGDNSQDIALKPNDTVVVP